MLYKKTLITASLAGVIIIGSGFVPKTFTISAATQPAERAFASIVAVVSDTPDVLAAVTEATSSENIDEEKPGTNISAVKPKTEKKKRTGSSVYTVPFYSQFSDISEPEWKKVGCGITSLAMLIHFYEPKENVSVDELLREGIAANAYLSDAGWSHAGLIGLSRKYGLSGESHDLRDSTMDSAFEVLKGELKEGPVMASVHYTFDPKNPIPHIVVVNGVRDGKVYYNDPAEQSGGGSISIAQFQSAWKKRYIDIRPIS